MAPVIKELERHPEHIRSVVCSVGQHRQMLDQVLQLFRIVPHYELNLMQTDQSLSQLTAALFSGLDKVLDEVKADWVLAQGDTTTVFVAADGGVLSSDRFRTRRSRPSNRRQAAGHFQRK